MSRSVVVTGANSGIGLVTVLELAGAGYDVIGTVRSAAKAELVQKAAADRDVEVRTVELDVNDAASTEAGFATVEEMTDGRLWAVVNNAGYAQAGAVEDITDEQVRAQLETNLVAPIRIARLVLPGMKARGEGRIVNVSSVAGRLSTPLMGWYCASKHGLEAVTDALRMEVEADGVRVVLVEPGMFGTDIWSAAEAGSLPEPSSARYAAAYARSEALSAQTKRLPDPVWVARTIRIALSNPLPMARYVVGADAVGGILAETLVPTVVTDYVKAFTTGLRDLPVKIPFLK
ncbi:MAG: Short-chain dehydrogenase/reductase [Frankiales bacterium]|jgi:NAD(P)-dependent dehydrogenase (short-subunit alcohol dehydrogenase family)|nr:Short-chain dehydrogenase/reductase [Frankiales bacterium]MCW2665659.1 Short-chain dehydrogenase/reductase [Frankiales bacterium]